MKSNTDERKEQNLNDEELDKVSGGLEVRDSQPQGFHIGGQDPLQSEVEPVGYLVE